MTRGSFEDKASAHSLAGRWCEKNAVWEGSRRVALNDAFLKIRRSNFSFHLLCLLPVMVESRRESIFDEITIRNK